MSTPARRSSEPSKRSQPVLFLQYEKNKTFIIYLKIKRVECIIVYHLHLRYVYSILELYSIIHHTIIPHHKNYVCRHISAEATSLIIPRIFLERYRPLGVLKIQPPLRMHGRIKRQETSPRPHWKFPRHFVPQRALCDLAINLDGTPDRQRPPVKLFCDRPFDRRLFNLVDDSGIVALQ